MTTRIVTVNGIKYITNEPLLHPLPQRKPLSDHKIAQSEKTKIMAIKDLENALKRIIELEAMLEQQTARIVDLQTHIENLTGEE